MIRTIKDIFYAITSPEKYRDFMNYRMRRLLLYVLILVFGTSIFSIWLPAAGFLAQGGIETLLEEEIPEFTVSSENGLWIEEPVEIDVYNFLIKVDSDVVRDDIHDLDGQFGTYEYVIMADREQIYVKSVGMGEITARYDEVPGLAFSKEDIMNYIPMMYAAVIWVLLLLLLTDYGYYFLSAMVISWIASVMAALMKVRIKNMKLFKMAVYAGTLSYLVEFMQGVIGFSIPNYQIFSYILTLGYLYFALKDYREYGIEELPPEETGGKEDRL